MFGHILKLLKHEDGTTEIEYGLIAVLIAAVIVGTVAAIGTKVGILYQSIVDNFPR